METTIWHNPRCSKSRQALALLREHGVEPTIRLYLDEPPSRVEIVEVIEMLGIEARGLLRTGEDVFKELNLREVSDSAALIDAMASHPRLIERPVVIRGTSAALGRPPENVLTLF